MLRDPTTATLFRGLPDRGRNTARKLRIALYSHDTMGLGHMRRNLCLATTFAALESRPAILMITGAPEAIAFAMPAGMHCLTLPALGKGTNGQYHPRSPAISLKELISLRANAICAALESFEPDVFIVDKVPLGALRELEPGLETLRSQGRTQCVLGLREVLDDPETTRREGRRMASDAAIRAYYDAVWVYGDHGVYDTVRECGFSQDVVAKVHYAGYLGPCVGNGRSRGENVDLLAALRLPPGRMALCLVGGGQDGFHLAAVFARTELPPNTNGVILTGPYMPPAARQRLRSIAAERPRLRVLGFVTEPERLLCHADSVVAMGGYNTVCEILSFEKRALIVPRVKPRREQLIRAERLQDLGLLDMLHPDDLTPEPLFEWLSGDGGPPTGMRSRIDLGGLARLPHLLAEVLTNSSRVRRRERNTHQDLRGLRDSILSKVLGSTFLTSQPQWTSENPGDLNAA